MTCSFILIASPNLAHVPIQVKPPITQVYSQRKNPLVACPLPDPSPLDQVSHDHFIKTNFSVFI